MLILSIRNENKYYDDKAKCSREQAFIIAVGSEFALSMNMSLHDDQHCASPPAETKNFRDKSNVLGDVKIISEGKKYYSITFVPKVDMAI